MRWFWKTLFGLALTALFLLPFFNWIGAEPVPYRDPEGAFSIDTPEGWKADDSGYMGKGVVMKGPAGPAGIEPVIHLLHEGAGIVTLDVLWHTHLGRLRYELDRVKFQSLDDFEEAEPPFSQARYTYGGGGVSYEVITRALMHDKRFYLLTATSPVGEFEGLLPLFRATFDSMRPGKVE